MWKALATRVRRGPTSRSGWYVHRPSVRKLDALAQSEIGGPAVLGDAPFLGKFRLDPLTIGGQANQPVKYRQFGENRRIILGIIGIQREDIPRSGDYKRPTLHRRLSPGASSK